MAISHCCFETDRLVVDDWPRFLSVDTAEALRNTFLVSLLTDPVTRDLPPAWQGPYDTDRASSWFVERQSESTVLLIVDRSDGRPVGLVILSESGNSDQSLDIRLGYMIDENAWGRDWRPRSWQVSLTGAEPTEPYDPSLVVLPMSTVRQPRSSRRTDSFLTTRAPIILPTRWSTNLRSPHRPLIRAGRSPT
jgi:hypothetical protein